LCDNDSNWVEKISALLEARQMMKKMSLRAKETAKEKFSSHKNFEILEKALTAL
jgi:hypothetical protein